MNSCRGVSIRSGSRLLMVTLSAATSRLIAFEIAVSAARAEVERPMSYLGPFTIAEVILMMRPKLVARIRVLLRRSAHAANTNLTCGDLVYSSSELDRNLFLYNDIERIPVGKKSTFWSNSAELHVDNTLVELSSSLNLHPLAFSWRGHDSNERLVDFHLALRTRRRRWPGWR